MKQSINSFHHSINLNYSEQTSCNDNCDDDDDDDGCSNFIVDRATFGADATGLMITVCGCCMVVETGFRQLAIG